MAGIDLGDAWADNVWEENVWANGVWAGQESYPQGGGGGGMGSSEWEVRKLQGTARPVRISTRRPVRLPTPRR